MPVEFDTTDITEQISSLRLELDGADRLNGKLIHLLESVYMTWAEYGGGDELRIVMRKVEAALEIEEHKNDVG